MEKSTEKILEAKQSGNKDIVQKLQQGMDKYKKEINKTFKKIGDSLNDSSTDDNRILREVAEGSLYNEVIDDVGRRYDPMLRNFQKNLEQKTTTAEDIVEYIKENYPETEEMFQKELNNMYMTFCKKQYDYGPNNIAMGTLLKNDKEINTSLLGIIVRMNDKINRLLNLSTKHDFKAQNEPIEDAFLDIAIYCLMALIVKSGKWSK